MLRYYRNNKESLDSELAKSMDFEYNVIDKFNDSGNKMPSILAENSVFVDCTYLNKDIYDIIFNLALTLKEHNYGLFVVARQRLNQLLVVVRDKLNLCEFVPEVDIVLKDQLDIYSQSHEKAEAYLHSIESDLRLILKTDAKGR